MIPVAPLDVFNWSPASQSCWIWCFISTILTGSVCLMAIHCSLSFSRGTLLTVSKNWSTVLSMGWGPSTSAYLFSKADILSYCHILINYYLIHTELLKWNLCKQDKENFEEEIRESDYLRLLSKEHKLPVVWRSWRPIYHHPLSR